MNNPTLEQKQAALEKAKKQATDIGLQLMVAYSENPQWWRTLLDKIANPKFIPANNTEIQALMSLANYGALMLDTTVMQIIISLLRKTEAATATAKPETAEQEPTQPLAPQSAQAPTDAGTSDNTPAS